MLLFEVVDEGPRPGFKLVLRHGKAGVPMGYDEKYQGDTWLPLGNSIDNALAHPDDQQIPFKLLHAHLNYKSIGFCLTVQPAEEAVLEKRALVLVDGCTDPEVGVTNIAEAFDRPMPELVTHTQGDGHSRRLYIFNHGDALFISWSAASLDASRPKRFIVTWDAEKQQLLELAVGRPRRNSRPPKKQEKRHPRVARASVNEPWPEIRPE